MDTAQEQQEALSPQVGEGLVERFDLPGMQVRRADAVADYPLAGPV